jgi:hypothetical protein
MPASFGSAALLALLAWAAPVWGFSVVPIKGTTYSLGIWLDCGQILTDKGVPLDPTCDVSQRNWKASDTGRPSMFGAAELPKDGCCIHSIVAVKCPEVTVQTGPRQYVLTLPKSACK